MSHYVPLYCGDIVGDASIHLLNQSVLFLLQETRAPNVMKMVQEFNRLALLVPTEVLEEKTASARAKVITCYIQVMS